MERVIAVIVSLLCAPWWLLQVALASARARCLPSIYRDPLLCVMELHWGDHHMRFTLVSVVFGYLRLTGPKPGSAASSYFEPGVCSPEQLQQAMGLKAEASDETFFSQANLKARLALAARTLFAQLYGQHEVDAAHPEVRVFGVQFLNATMAEAVSTITGFCKSPGIMGRVFFVNADCLNVAYGDRDYHYLLHDADLVLPDGSGVRMALKSLGTNMLENLNGTDLYPKLCAAAADQGLSLYLLGGQPGIAERTALSTMSEVPGLKIVGWHDGYFSEEQSDQVVDEINRSNADILLVGLGAPRQERWLSKHADNLKPGVGIGVGGLFDYYSGEVVRAPIWMRELGLEWVWRMLQQPGDKWRRYVLGNPIFLARVLRQRLSLGKGSWLALGYSLGGSSFTATPRRRFPQATTSLKLLLWRTTIVVRRYVKRGLDLTLSVTAMALLTPLLLLLALAVKLTSPGPIFFKQVRIGERGKPFLMWKFRSMQQDAESRRAALAEQNESKGQVLFKMKRDPRITLVGRWMRRFSLDELPQLFNVLGGTMSLVGPRPALASEVDQYEAANLRRLQGKPGLTCDWQVSGRSDLSFDEQMSLDVEYLSKQSLSQDLSLLARTFPAVLSGRGAS